MFNILWQSDVGIGEPPLRNTRFSYFPKKKTYLSVQIDQISPTTFIKHVLALQDDFGMQKKLVNKHKKWDLVRAPPLRNFPVFFWPRP